MPAADDGLQPQRRSEARVEPRVLSRHHFPYTALDPVKKAPFEVMARDTRLRFLASRGLGALTEANETVREVLLRPLKVFSGIRKDEDESPDGDGWLCYVGKPKKRYRHATGAPYPPQSNALFLVYVTHERVVYNWRWEDEDDHNPGYPKDCENRYRTLVFP